MKKLFMILIFLFTGFSIFAANENDITSAAPKYFGQYVSYKNPQGVWKKDLGEIILLKNNTLTFYSHKRCKNYVFTFNNGYLEYKKNTKSRRIKYDSSKDALYAAKPGPWLFIPAKTVWERISNDAAEKQIKKWQ